MGKLLADLPSMVIVKRGCRKIWQHFNLMLSTMRNTLVTIIWVTLVGCLMIDEGGH